MRGDRPSDPPSDVAPPLPPRPRRKIVNQRPTNVARPASATTTGRSGHSALAAVTGRNPFSASHSSTNTAHFLPGARATLVAPMLPLPTVRPSMPRALPASNPEGNDPSTYAPALRQTA